MNKQEEQDKFKEQYRMGVKIAAPMTKEKLENKHGIDNPVEDLNITGSPGSIPLSSLEPIPDHKYIGNISGADQSPEALDLGINVVFRTVEGLRVTVVNGLVTIATSTSTSSSSSSSSSITTSSSSHSTSSSSSSSVSTSSSSSSSS